MWFYKLLAGYLILINVTAFFLMLADKQKAKRKRWHIPEATLLATAFFGGSIGVLLGMYTVRHKTKHPQFTVGVPLIIVLQLIFAILIIAKITVPA